MYSRCNGWLISAVLFAMCVSCPARADLVGLWRFDANVDPQPDSSEFKNDAAVVEATWVDDPVRGGVMNFEGEGDNNPVQWLEVEDSDSLSIEESGLTIATWANFTQFESWNSILAKTGESAMNKPSPYDMYTHRETGLPQFFVGEGNGTIEAVTADGDPPEVDEWTHIAVTMDEEGEVIHYLNGEVNGEGFIDRETVLLIDEDTPLFIGSRFDGTTNMHGMLDDVSIFNHALTADEIANIRAGDYSAYIGDPCDYNSDGVLNIADVDLLSAEIKAGTNNTKFDVNGDGEVNSADLNEYVQSPDKLNTYMGDANFDLEFNSSDLVTVFSAGKYEDEIAMNATWAEGDWNGDAEFNSSDLVVAFAAGGYEAGPRTAAVPEPTSLVLLVLGWIGFWSVRRR